VDKFVDSCRAPYPIILEWASDSAAIKISAAFSFKETWRYAKESASATRFPRIERLRARGVD
jgi:hypothetical protein